ncbi:hypothetical protein, partial [Xanthovirga aplysinae]|uniref:hypothetical protein n=1 Tax=Xanthovirga aplysinae TaxID=2529853 RepID=UPI001656C466
LNEEGLLMIHSTQLFKNQYSIEINFNNFLHKYCKDIGTELVEVTIEEKFQCYQKLWTVEELTKHTTLDTIGVIPLGGMGEFIDNSKDEYLRYARSSGGRLILLKLPPLEHP